MTLKLMTRFLDGHQIDYAQGEASVGHDRFPAEESEPVLSRTVMLNIDGSAAMAVIPAGHTLRTELLQELIEAQNMRPAESDELLDLFPDCEADAIPPLGTLHGMRVFVAESLSRSGRLAFCAGSRSRVIEMPWRD
ncbi:MAG TPA: YbaK/EbsC family protein, partial [Tepidisphaeraceae bacterium]|nr:YbaK/EbsC family protein [Tepidisphaeraceae bacterium]